MFFFYSYQRRKMQRMTVGKKTEGADESVRSDIECSLRHIEEEQKATT